MDRDALIIEHFEWAKREARRWAAAIAPDDVEGVALEALVEASRSWRQDMSTFPAWAKRIIYRRIQDAKRTEDTATRYERDLQAAGLRPAPVRRFTSGPVTAVDAKQPREMHDGSSAIVSHTDLMAMSRPASQEATIDARRALLKIASVLPPRLARVVALHALGWRLKDIGADLGVTESRACQLLKEALSYLGDPP